VKVSSKIFNGPKRLETTFESGEEDGPLNVGLICSVMSATDGQYGNVKAKHVDENTVVLVVPETRPSSDPMHVDQFIQHVALPELKDVQPCMNCDIRKRPPFCPHPRKRKNKQK